MDSQVRALLGCPRGSPLEQRVTSAVTGFRLCTLRAEISRALQTGLVQSSDSSVNVLVCKTDVLPSQDAGTLVLIDSSLQERTSTIPGLHKVIRRETEEAEEKEEEWGVPAVLVGPARLALDRVMVISKWKVVPLARPSKRDGLTVTGLRCTKGAGTAERSEENDRWEQWPDGVSNRLIGGVYIEIEQVQYHTTSEESEQQVDLDLQCIGEQERKTDSGVSGKGTKRLRDRDRVDWALVRVDAVSPIMPAEVPFWFLKATVLKASRTAMLSTSESTCWCLQGHALVFWHVNTRPGDVIVLKNAVFRRNYKVEKRVFDIFIVDVRREGTLTRSKVPSEVAVRFGKDEGIVERLNNCPGAPCTVVGTVTRRVGAFVIEIDDDAQAKVFFSHVPVANGGLGLRVGARVRLENVHLVHIRGRLQGFVLSMRSSYTILQASTSHDAPFFRFSVTFQRILGKCDAQVGYWILEGLGKISEKFGRGIISSVSQTKHLVEALKALRLTFMGEEALAVDALVQKRSIMTEFLAEELTLCPPQVIPHQNNRSLSLKALRSKLPYIATVAQLRAKVFAHLASQQVNGSTTYKSVSPQQTTGLDSDVSVIDPTDLFNHSENIVLIGWLVFSSRTSQLELRDKTGSIEVCLKQHDEASRLIQSYAASPNRRSEDPPVCIALQDFDLVVESLGCRLSLGPVELDERSAQSAQFSLWDSEYVRRGDVQGHAVFRFYVEPRVRAVVHIVDLLVRDDSLSNDKESGEGNKDRAMGVEQQLTVIPLVVPCVMNVQSSRGSNVEYGMFDAIVRRPGSGDNVLIQLDKAKPAPFPRNLHALSLGKPVVCEGLRRVPSSSSSSSSSSSVAAAIYIASPETVFFESASDEEEEEEEESAVVVNVWQVYSEPERCISQKYWILRGVVTAITLRENFSSGSAGTAHAKALSGRTLALELRDVTYPHTILCYVDPIAGRYVVPGVFRVGSTIDVFTPKRVELPNRGVYCQCSMSCNFRVLSTTYNHSITPPQMPPDLPKESSRMDLMLEKSILSPGKIFFHKTSFVIVEIHFVVLSRRCTKCGMEFRSSQPNACSSPKCEGNRGYAVGCKFECVVEDGSGQGYLIAHGETAKTLLRENWNEACELLRKHTGSSLTYNMRQLTAPNALYTKEAEDLDRAHAGKGEQEDKRSIQEQFEDLVLQVQSSAFSPWTSVVKVQGNVRKKGGSKASMFQQDKIYMRDLHLSRDVIVQTATLPRLTLVPLLIEQINATEFLRQTLL